MPVQQEVLRQQKWEVWLQTSTSRLVEYQTKEEQVNSPEILATSFKRYFLFVRKFQFNFETECQTESSVVCSYIFLPQPPPSSHYLFWPDEALLSWPRHLSLNFYQAKPPIMYKFSVLYVGNAFKLFSSSKNIWLYWLSWFMQLKSEQYERFHTLILVRKIFSSKSWQGEDCKPQCSNRRGTLCSSAECQ